MRCRRLHAQSKDSYAWNAFRRMECGVDLNAEKHCIQVSLGMTNPFLRGEKSKTVLPVYFLNLHKSLIQTDDLFQRIWRECVLFSELNRSGG